MHLYFGAMHLLDLFWRCIYKDLGALHLFDKPQSGGIFVENKLPYKNEGAAHRNISLTISFSADPN